jgi:N-acyl-D-aspartate/D-glutamate deacylase
LGCNALTFASSRATIFPLTFPCKNRNHAHAPPSAGVRSDRQLARAERAWVAVAAGAIHRCALRPAQILEASVPQMKNKGRLKVGADADVIVFDPKTVRDRATYLEPNRTSVGMRSVPLNGVFVIRDAELVKTAFPGKPVRRPVQ